MTFTAARDKTKQTPQRLFVATAAMTLAIAGVFATAELSGVADAKKKQENRRVGKYKGTTEAGGPVSFRFTKNRRIINFSVPGAKLYCGITPAPGQPRQPDYEKGTVDIAAPPIRVTGVAKFEFSDPFPGGGLPYARNFVKGKPGGTSALKGTAAYGSANGDDQATGTEVCATGILDWTARKKKKS